MAGRPSSSASASTSAGRRRAPRASATASTRSTCCDALLVALRRAPRRHRARRTAARLGTIGRARARRAARRRRAHGSRDRRGARRPAAWCSTNAASPTASTSATSCTSARDGAGDPARAADATSTLGCPCWSSTRRPRRVAGTCPPLLVIALVDDASPARSACSSPRGGRWTPCHASPDVAAVLSPASDTIDNYLLVGSDSRDLGDPQHRGGRVRSPATAATRSWCCATTRSHGRRRRCCRSRATCT